MRGRGDDKESLFIITPRIMIIFVIIMLLIPASFVIYSTQFRGKINVGIVLVENISYDYSEIARDSLNDFHDVFSAKVLDARFNESEIRIRNGLFLTDDYFDDDFAKSIRENYNIDIILIITDKNINNWLDDRMARWGQADTKTGIALVTIFPILNGTIPSSVYVTSIGRHEVLHILGYGHPNRTRECLMRSSTIETELCHEYELVLPYYASLWKIGLGHDPGEALFLIRVTFLMLFSPIFIVAIITLNLIFKKYIYKKDKINPNPLILALGGLYIIIMLSAVFIMPLYPQIIALSAAVFVYLIIESLHFELLYKPKQNNVGNEPSND
jgi:hypothetical protein